MDTIVLATRNKGKIKEFNTLLKPFGVTVKSLAEFPEIGDIPETGETFRENALIKARAVAQATSLVAVADDSGIEVDAIGGAPGVYSARYAGEACDDHANNEKLLEALKDVSDAERTARYRCVMAAVAPNGTEVTTEGNYEGFVAREYKGSGGFGYDVLFIDPEYGQHAAELTPEQKHARSHRGEAIRNLLDIWPDFWSKATL